MTHLVETGDIVSLIDKEIKIEQLRADLREKILLRNKQRESLSITESEIKRLAYEYSQL